MKKYFTLIAFAVLALSSSVLTSCDKNDAGSSYNPEVLTTQTAVETPNDLDSCYAYATFQGYNYTRDMPATEDSVMTNLEKFYQSKVGSLSTIKKSDHQLTFVVKRCNADAFKAVLTSVDFNELSSQALKTVNGLAQMSIQFSRLGKDNPYYHYVFNE